MIEYQKKLSLADRFEIIKDICKVYKYSDNNKIVLYKKTDKQLISFRENLRKRHELLNPIENSKIYIQAILNHYGANKYYIVKEKNKIRVYIGYISNLKDKFGRYKKYQYGFIDIVKTNVINNMIMYGKKLNKYNGSRLIIE